MIDAGRSRSVRLLTEDLPLTTKSDILTLVADSILATFVPWLQPSIYILD